MVAVGLKSLDKNLPAWNLIRRQSLLASTDFPGVFAEIRAGEASAF
jgi:hypothetical protein